MFVRFLCCMLRPSPSYSFLCQHTSYCNVIAVQRCKRCDFYKYQVLIYCMGIMLLVLYFSSLTTNKTWYRIVQIT